MPTGSRKAEACFRLLETHQRSGVRDQGPAKCIRIEIKALRTGGPLQARGLHEASDSVEIQLVAEQRQEARALRGQARSQLRAPVSI